MPPGKRRMHSVSGRHYYDLDSKHPSFSGRHPKLLIISDLYREVKEISEVLADIARSLFEVHFTPFTFINTMVEIDTVCVRQTFQLQVKTVVSYIQIPLSSTVKNRFRVAPFTTRNEQSYSNRECSFHSIAFFAFRTNI